MKKLFIIIGIVFLIIVLLLIFAILPLTIKWPFSYTKKKSKTCPKHSKLINDKCVCDIGWYGLNCQNYKKDCDHGHQDKDSGGCICDKCWQGTLCNTKMGCTSKKDCDTEQECVNCECVGKTCQINKNIEGPGTNVDGCGSTDYQSTVSNICGQFQKTDWYDDPAGDPLLSPFNIKTKTDMIGLCKNNNFNGCDKEKQAKFLERIWATYSNLHNCSGKPSASTCNDKGYMGMNGLCVCEHGYDPSNNCTKI